MILTLGYDPQRERFVGTWIGSMMSILWVYDGRLETGGKSLFLDTEGPSFTGEGKTSKYRELIEWKSDDLRKRTSSVLSFESLGAAGEQTRLTKQSVFDSKDARDFVVRAYNASEIERNKFEDGFAGMTVGWTGTMEQLDAYLAAIGGSRPGR